MSGHNAAADLVNAGFDILDGGNASAIASPAIQGGVVALETTGAETRTLSNPERAGLVITLCLQTDGGDCVVTAASAINQTGNTVMTLADAGDEITLKSIRSGSSFVYRVVSNDGVALS